MDKKHLNTILGEIRERLEELYGERLCRLMLYGSQARGDAEAGSDVDVLVVLAGEVNPSAEIAKASEITASLSLQYDIVISCVYMSEARFQRERSPLLLNVRREGMVM